jgi:Ser/Thr protein kinase RdoA (MazF antagonist)
MKDFYSLTYRGRAQRLRKIALAALEDYDLDADRVRLITNSYNGIFRVDTSGGQKYVLRVCLPLEHTREQIHSEMVWLHALRRETDLLVPQPLITRNGDFFTIKEAAGVPEPRHCVIFSWVPGRDLDQQLTVENMTRFGAFAARLHKHAGAFDPTEGFSVSYRFDQVFPFNEPVILFEEAHRELLPPERRALFQNVVERVGSAIGRLKASGEPLRILHGDLHRWNVKVYRGKIGAFDFEELMWGWPVQDIATTLYYFYGEETYPALRDTFQGGYTTVAPWPERYPGEVDTFIAGRSLVLANTVLQDLAPEWRAEAPRYFERTEKRLRALLLGEGEYLTRYW